MANILSSASINSGQLIRSGHVTQSIKAFTGTEAYDITISGSLTVVGPTNINGDLSSFNLNVENTLIAGEFQIINLTVENVADIHYADIDSGSISASFYGDLTGIASTASYVTSSNVFGPYGRNSILSSSYALTSSYAASASVSNIANTALSTVSASYALTASYAVTSSKAIHSNNALSSSYALSASYAPSNGSGGSTFRMYETILSCSVGGNPVPTATTVNELGGSPSWTSNSGGTFTLTIAGAFTSNKSFAGGAAYTFYDITEGNFFNVYPEFVSSNVVNFHFINYNLENVDPKGPISIWVRVYN